MGHLPKFILLVVLLIIAACTTPVAPTKPTLIPPTTKVLDAAAKAAVETVQANALVFSGPQSFAVGDVLVSDVSDRAPNGFLRKITAVRQEAGKTIVETQSASLREAINQAKATFTRTFSSADIESSSLQPGVSLMRKDAAHQAEAPTFSFNKVLYDQDGNGDTKTDQIVLSGSLDIQPILNFDYDIDYVPLDFDFLAEVGFKQTSNLSLKGKVNDSFDKRVQIGQVRFKPITFSIGPVPVVVRPVLKLEVGLKGSLSGEVEYVVSQSLELVAGAKYDEEWRNTSRASFSATVDKSVLKVSANLRPSLFLTLEALLYESVGAYAKPEIFLDLDAQIPRDPFWKLDLGMGVDLGIAIDKWGIDKEYTKRVYETRKEIARSQNAAPEVVFTGSDNWPLNVPFPLNATISDVEQGPSCCTVSWTSDIDGPLGVGNNLSKAFTTTGLRTLTVTVTDPKGAVTRSSAAVQVTNTAPEIAISEPTQNSVIYPSVPYTFSAFAQDPNEPGGLLDCSRITWNSTAQDGFPKTGCTVEASFTTEAARTLTVTATDPQGLAAKPATVTLNVLPKPANLPPVVRILKPTQGSLPVGNVITLQGSVSDPEGDAFTTEWFASVGNTPNGTFGPEIKLTPDAEGKVNLDSAGVINVAQGFSGYIRITHKATDANNQGRASVTLGYLLIVP